MSTAHLALKYHRPQGVTGDPLRVATDLASNRSTTSVGVHGVGCEIRPRSSTTFRDPPPEYNPPVREPGHTRRHTNFWGAPARRPLHFFMRADPPSAPSGGGIPNFYSNIMREL